MRNVHQIREVSTLSFNERVLQEAEDRRNPPMERLKFLGIFSSNMDEFFKVRVASVQRRIELGHSGMQDVLEILAHKARELDERFRAAYGDITSVLAAQGIERLAVSENYNAQIVAKNIRGYFPQAVPLDPLAVILHAQGRHQGHQATGNGGVVSAFFQHAEGGNPENGYPK